MENIYTILENFNRVEEAEVEENAFNQAAADAAKAGKKSFEFDGKTYPVKMDKSTAHQLSDDVNEADKPDYIDIDKDGDKEESMKKAAKDAEKMKEDYDKDEYDEEGEMVKSQAKTIAHAAEELQDIIDDDENLPEWVQKKVTLAKEYIDTARDYMKANPDEEDTDNLEEKAVSRDQQELMGMAYAVRTGDMPRDDASDAVLKIADGDMSTKELKKFAGTKHKGLPEKKKKANETTVAGAVATATNATGSGVYGNPSVYENEFKQKFDALTESMNVSINAGNDGNQSMTVSAEGEDAAKLGHLLKMAGLFQSSEYKEPCPSCGKIHEGECTMEDYANEPEEQTQDTDFMTQTIAGGLNRPKNQVNPNNPGDNPLAMQKIGKTALNLEDSIKEGLNNLYKQYKGK